MAVRTHVRCHGRDQRLTLHPGGPPCGDRCFSGRMINQQEPTVDLRWVLKRWGPCRERLVESLVQRPLVVSGGGLVGTLRCRRLGDLRQDCRGLPGP